jgi:hypothetical protein
MFSPEDDRDDIDVNALIGWFMFGTWVTMLWAAVKLVQDVCGAVRDWRRPRRHALR